MTGGKYSEQYENDRRCALQIELGLKQIQSVIARHPLALKFILNAICSNPEDPGIVSYRYMPEETSEDSSNLTAGNAECEIKANADAKAEVQTGNEQNSEEQSNIVKAPAATSSEDLNQKLASLISDLLTGSISTSEFSARFTCYRLCFDMIEKILRMLGKAVHHHQTILADDDLQQIENGKQMIVAGQDELINRHRALIMSFINSKGRALTEIDRQDLEQEGYLALLNATDRYNFRLGNCYMTLAYYRVRQNIDSSISQLKNIRLPVNVMSKIAKMTIKEKQMTQKLGHIPLQQQLADELKISLKALNELQFLKKSGTMSYDSKIKDFENSDNSYSETIADTNQKDAWEIINEEQNKKLIAEMLKSLKPQAQKVLEMRFGFHNTEQMTREEIGEMLGVSRERVRQIETEALKKLMRNKVIRGIVSDHEDAETKFETGKS